MVGVDTNAYYSTQDVPLSTSTSPSSTHSTHGCMDGLADATTPCLHARVWLPMVETHERNNVVERGRKENGMYVVM